MHNLSEINFWKQNYGHLPIHLELGKESNYLMLNGGKGDFCLQIFNDNSTPSDFYSKSWSSNTKNFIVIENDDKVKIYNWLKNEPEEFSQKSVKEQSDKFYKYILSKSFRTERDVVPYIIDIFRQFRNITLERTNPVEALNLLFVLLTSLEDEDLSKFDSTKWNVTKPNIPADFEYFTNIFKKGVSNIKPTLDLIIRHSAGILFQEAQKEVLVFDLQRDLWGGFSNKIETKNKLYSSIHYTPPYIARTIVENTIKKLDLTKEKLKIFDPACGSSEFLIETLKQLGELRYKGKVEVKGWDSSETAVNTSRFLLKYEQRIFWNARLEFEIKLVNDSLTESWDDDYDLILMNPPFVSWELLGKTPREAVKETLGIHFKGKPNQGSAFFYKAIQCLNASGVIGCIIPSSLLTFDAYNSLRNAAYDLITINLIGKLGNFVFEDALTDVSLIVGNKPKTEFMPTILWTVNEKEIVQESLRSLRKMDYSNSSTVNEKYYSIFQPATFPIIPESWKPISLKENELLKTIERFIIERKLVRIQDIFNVQQGIRTGNNNIFKISTSQYQQLGSNEQKFFKPAIDNDSIKNGMIIPKNYLWFPYNSQNNESLIVNEDELKENVPEFYAKYLLPAKNLLKNRKKKVPYWWSLSDRAPRLIPFKKSIVSTEFGKSDSFAINNERDYAIERGYAWYSKKELSDQDRYFYLSILSSPLFDKLLSIYSRQLLSGWDLGKKFTKEIPIPNVHSLEANNSEAYTKLVEIGEAISVGNTFVKTVIDDILMKYFYPSI